VRQLPADVDRKGTQDHPEQNDRCR
jgi:hypothetical protein